MNEEPTKNLPSQSFEERLFAELAAMRNEFRTELKAIREDINRLDTRLTKLEERFGQLDEKVDRRLQETRPIWEAVQTQLGKLDRKFDLVIRDLYEVRQDHVVLAQRVDQLGRSRTE